MRSAETAANDYSPKKIYYSTTKDFVHFSAPQVLYEKEDSGVIDSAIYEENGVYYLFVKSESNPAKIILLHSDHAASPYVQMESFDESMKDVESGLYEAPTAVELDDSRWCLFLDYYGVPGAGQGYVPFVADSLAFGKFVRSDGIFIQKELRQASFWGSSCRSSFSLFFSDKTHPLPFCSGGQYLFCRLVNVSF